MNLASPALVFDVADMAASSDFAQTYLGFKVTAATDDFTVLEHNDHGLRLIFGPLATNSDAAATATLRELQVAFIVENIDEHWAQLKDRVEIGEPLQDLTLGDFTERFFQVRDPNGVVYRLLELP